MAMWDDILNGLGIENGAARVNADVDRIAGSERGANGSFNPNAVRAGLDPEMDPEVNLRATLTDARLKAMRENLREPTQSPLEFFGRTLSAASVPVAFAQGNTGFGLKMAGNTGADQFNDQKMRYRDALSKETAGIVDGAYADLGTSAIDHMKSKRERLREARLKAADILRAGQNSPESVRTAAAWLRANGDKDSAAEIEGALGRGPSAPGQGAPSAAPSGVPGAVVQPPMGGAPPAGVPAAPGTAPAPQAQLPANLAQAKAQAQELRNRAAIEDAINKGAGKPLYDQADRIEAGAVEYEKQFSKDSATAEADKGQKAQMANTIREQAGSYIKSLEDTLKVPGIDRYIGPIEGGPVGKYVLDTLNDFVPGNEANPAYRDQIVSTQSNLVQLLKPFLRVAGEGSQDQREFQSIIDSVGDLTSSRNAAEGQQKLNNLKQRMSVMLAKYDGAVPDITQMRTSAGAAPGAQAPAAPAAAQEPVGASRVVNGTTYVKTAAGWVPQGQAQQPSLPSGPFHQNYTRGGPVAR